MALAIGLAVGIAGTAAVHAGTVPTPRPDPVPKPTAEPGTAPVPLDVGVQLLDEPSLARFDVPETEADIPPEEGWLELLRADDPDAEVRLLGSHGDVTAYGARLTVDGLGRVCLYLRRATTGSATCVSDGEFQVEGIEHPEGGSVFHWGPVGPPYAIFWFWPP